MTLQHCPLNVEFQHFIPRFNKNSLLWGPHSKKGIESEKRRPQRRGKERVTLRKTGMALDLLCQVQSSNHGI
jgi:hypothetical protein